MKVALFAPYLSPAAGGTWQFYQWVAKQLGSKLPLVLFAPALLLEEIRKGGGEYAVEVPFETLRSSVEETIAYRILEDPAFGQIGGIRIPLYRKLTRQIKRLFFATNVLEQAAYKMLLREGVDVVHIPVQRVRMPSTVKRFPYIINPHDFQHEYFPEFFTKKVLEFRRTAWYKDQRDAAAVVVHSRQTRSDAIKYLGIPEERVFYAPYGPLDNFPVPDEVSLRKVAQEFALPERFVFYPALTWVHKNHLVLVEAIHHLKKRGIDVNAVFTIVDGEYGEMVKQKIKAAGLVKQVIIVGRVSPEQMGALYCLCTMVVVPSLFEQNSGPVLEAIHFGKAVAVSHIEEVVLTLNGSGLLFDPRSVSEIADAIDQLWSSKDALEKVEAKIRERRTLMSWEPFQEVYQQAYTYAMQEKS
jgi:glycosyltransferase involved in cell wall biosynthesis